MKQKKEIHVVYIITKLELGGAQKVCLTLLNGLTQAGKTATLISGAQGALVNQIAHMPNVILLDSLQREVGLSSLLREIKNFIYLAHKLRKLKKQYPHLIVHTHSTKAGLIGRWAAWFAGIKKRIHTIHGYGFHSHQRTMVWCIIYLLELVTSFITTHYICVSSDDVKTGIKLFPRFAKKHSIIRSAISWQEFFIPALQARDFPTQDPFIFGTVSCFKEQKNLFDLLRSFEYVYQRNNNIRLEIIGDGHLRIALEFWIKEHYLTKMITLHGWQEHVAPFMMQWNAFILSSLWEGLPCAVVEARLLKLPVLSYDTGGIHDVIVSGENGFLYPQGQWQELAQGMLKLTQHPDLYQKLQTTDESLYDFNDTYMVNQHIKLYDSLR